MAIPLRGNMSANNAHYADRIYQGRMARTFSSHGNRESVANAAARMAVAEALATHHADVPKAGGGHGGNPNHDEQGRFT